MNSTGEMIFTGDELLRGDAINTNQAYLGEKLLDLGILATHALCVADDRQAIVAAIRESLARGPVVLILSGGLGPTTSPARLPLKPSTVPWSTTSPF
jgi:nicotinamide-nucleotide amidase